MIDNENKIEMGKPDPKRNRLLFSMVSRGAAYYKFFFQEKLDNDATREIENEVTI